MASLFGMYFFGLFKRLIVVLFFTSFVIFFLMSYRYSNATLALAMEDLLLFSVPWLLWFNQAAFTGFFTPRNIFARVFFVFFSTLISTAVLMIFIGFFAVIPEFKISNIRPNIVTPEGSVIHTKSGTLIIDNTPTPPIFTDSNKKAVFVSTNITYYNNIRTNSQTFELENFGSTFIVPFYEGSTNKSYIIDIWLNRISYLNQNLEDIYTLFGIPLPKRDSTPYVLTNNTNRVPVDNLSFVEAPMKNSAEPDGEPRNPDNIPYSFINYINIILALLCLFCAASILGILMTLGQNYLGASALVFLSSIFLSGWAVKIMELIIKGASRLPSYSMLVINACMIAVLYVLVFAVSFLKNKHREQSNKKLH